MNLTDSFILKCQCGQSILLDDICAVYPATLREIASIGYDNFQEYLSIMLIEKPSLDSLDIKSEDFKKAFKKMSDFQYLMLLVSVDKDFSQKAKNAFRFFIHDNVFFSTQKEQIIVGPIEEKHILNEDSFITLQSYLRKMYFISIEQDEIIINKDDSPRTKQLKKQMIENRKKVLKAKKSSGNAQSGDGVEFSDLVGSVALAVHGLNILNIWDLTYYAFQDQLRRMGWYEKYNTNMRAAMAGAKIKKQELSHWLKSIASDK